MLGPSDLVLACRSREVCTIVLKTTTDQDRRIEVRRLKIAVAIAFAMAIIAALASESLASPPFVAKSRKFGAKDCTFCHVEPEGGPPWNDRGKWLVAEKER